MAKIVFGRKYLGRELEEVIKIDPSYLIWYHKNKKGIQLSAETLLRCYKNLDKQKEWQENSQKSENAYQRNIEQEEDRSWEQTLKDNDNFVKTYGGGM